MRSSDQAIGQVEGTSVFSLVLMGFGLHRCVLIHHHHHSVPSTTITKKKLLLLFSDFETGRFIPDRHDRTIIEETIRHGDNQY